MTTLWTSENREAAAAQGWGIFETDGSENGTPYQLQRIDDPEFGVPVLDNDDAAWCLVRIRAANGDELAKSALAYLKEHSPAEFGFVMGLAI
jgi:hypothetical protein